jgi:hypothetical protein
MNEIFSQIRPGLPTRRSCHHCCHPTPSDRSEEEKGERRWICSELMEHTERICLSPSVNCNTETKIFQNSVVSRVPFPSVSTLSKVSLRYEMISGARFFSPDTGTVEEVVTRVLSHVALISRTFSSTLIPFILSSIVVTILSASSTTTSSYVMRWSLSVSIHS